MLSGLNHTVKLSTMSMPINLPIRKELLNIEELLIKDYHSLVSFYNEFKHIKEFAFDTETTGLDIASLQLVAISLYSPEYEKAVSILFNFSASYYIKVKDPQNTRRKIDKEMEYEQTDFIDFEEAKDIIVDIFKGADIIAANAKFDIKVARKYDFFNFNLKDDVVAQAHHIDPDSRAGLKQNVKKYLKINMDTYEDTVGQKANNIDWTEVNWDVYGSYSCKDALYTWYLSEVLSSKLAKYENIQREYRNIAIPITLVIADMEYNGVKIDVPLLKKMGKEITGKIKELEEIIYDIAGVEFNIGSSKQLGEVLFDRLHYPVIERTEKGARAVGEGILKELDFRGYPLPKYLLTYRKYTKLKTTYIDAIPEMIGDDGLLHGTFNPNGTRTSRLCVGEDTLIETNRGLIRIGELIPEEEGVVEIEGYKALTHKGEYKDIQYGINKGYEEMYEVELENGYKIQCTLEHKFLTNCGWLSLRVILLIYNEHNGVDIVSYIHEAFKPIRLIRATKVGVKKVCDITVKDHSSYIGNGMVNHNSSSSPNLQNQPNNKEFPVRKAFIPRAKDRVLIVGDYSQIELRVLAHYSKDVNLTQAFLDKVDLHSKTANDINKVTGLHLSRAQGKTLNFATVYLMSPDSLMYRLNADLAVEVTQGKITEEEYLKHKVTLRQARQMINGFFGVYSGVKKYIEALALKVKEEGRVFTLGGFGRPIPELRRRTTFSMGRRLAINTKIQGSASDIIKMAMIKIKDRLYRENVDALMILQVHDELVFDVNKHDAKKALKIIREEAEGVFPTCRVPLLFDIDIFSNWAEMKGGKEQKDYISELVINNLI